MTPNCKAAQWFGEVAERLKAPHSKCGIRATVSGVRIPPSPPRPNYLSLLRNTAPSSRILPRFPGLCDTPNRQPTTETILPGTSSDQGLRISWGVFGGTVVSARHGKQRVFSARPQDNKALDSK